MKIGFKLIKICTVDAPSVRRNAFVKFKTNRYVFLSIRTLFV